MKKAKCSLEELCKMTVKENIKKVFNGVYFKKQEKKDIISSVKRFGEMEFGLKEISDFAKKFLSKRFLTEFQGFYEKVV